MKIKFILFYLPLIIATKTKTPLKLSAFIIKPNPKHHLNYPKMISLYLLLPNFKKELSEYLQEILQLTIAKLEKSLKIISMIKSGERTSVNLKKQHLIKNKILKK
jgi:hypothetical protein